MQQVGNGTSHSMNRYAAHYAALIFVFTMATQTFSAYGYLLYPNPRNQHREVFEFHLFVPHPYAIIDIPTMALQGKTSVFAACRESDKKMGQVVTFELEADVARFEKRFTP